MLFASVVNRIRAESALRNVRPAPGKTTSPFIPLSGSHRLRQSFSDVPASSYSCPSRPEIVFFLESPVPEPFHGQIESLRTVPVRLKPFAPRDSRQIPTSEAQRKDARLYSRYSRTH